MRGQRGNNDELADFVSARTAELHRAAYLLTADQDRAERLVAAAVDRLRRDRTPLGQAGNAARRYMARLAAAATEPSDPVGNEPSSPSDELRAAIAGMSPRERAVLMLRSLDHLDERGAATELGISTNAVREAASAAGKTLGLPIDSEECRSALADFAERATWPDTATTMAAAQRTAPPQRRASWRYIAAAAVVVVGAAAPIASQVHHDRWSRSPEGINATHGTHFHAYVQGFKLVGVQRVPVGATRKLTTPDGEAIALGCDHLSLQNQSEWPHIRGTDGSEPYPCAKQTAERYFLLEPDTGASLLVPKAAPRAIDVARYKPVPWNRYPVAKDHFTVEHDIKLDRNARLNFGSPPVRSGRTLTMHGTNGTFMGKVTIPPPAKNTRSFLSGLLSPTTTGQFKVEIDGIPATDCTLGGSSNATNDGWCRLHDRYVPQIPLLFESDSGEGGIADERPARVKVQVRDALGPWTFQIRYERYRPSE